MSLNCGHYRLAQLLPLFLKILTMKKILVGALVCAAVAAVVYYLADPEKFYETVGDLKNKAKDGLGKAKDAFGKARSSFDDVEKDVRSTVG